jgi:endonuclease/exonuclease/phosphatase family metal-dependent hydrolase
MNSFFQRRRLAGSGACAAFLAVFCASVSCSAGVGAARGDSTFSLTCWNVQTFFDGETSGAEYAEYRGAKSFWSREKYRARLKRLCESVAAFDSDVLAFEEIENEETVADIANELYGHLARNKLYPYACFARGDGGSIGCAVLSRFPLQSCTVHQCDFRASVKDAGAPRMRPLMEVTLAVSDSAPPVRLLVNHWKSKSGGEDNAAFWQKQQEAVLSRRIGRVSSESAVVVCGDFNRDLSEFAQESAEVLLRADIGGGENVPVVSGWLLFPESATGAGSYYYRGAWERIDHIFTAGRCTMRSFRARADGPWAREQGGERLPYRYQISSGAGYSDHLPIQCVVSLQQNAAPAPTF